MSLELIMLIYCIDGYKQFFSLTTHCVSFLNTCTCRACLCCYFKYGITSHLLSRKLFLNILGTSLSMDNNDWDFRNFSVFIFQLGKKYAI